MSFRYLEQFNNIEQSRALTVVKNGFTEECREFRVPTARKTVFAVIDPDDRPQLGLLRATVLTATATAVFPKPNRYCIIAVFTGPGFINKSTRNYEEK